MTPGLSGLPVSVPPPVQDTSEVIIRNPLDGATVKPDAVYLQGNARTPDQEIVGDALVWTSNLLQTPILTGTGDRVDLPEGTHLITLTATIPDGETVTDQITINVQW